MKNRVFIAIAILFACGLGVSSCIDDKGNYVYEDAADVLPVTISEVEDMTVMNNTNLKISPELGDGTGEYAYSWYVTPTEPGGFMPRKTILSTERDLDVVVTLEPNEYFLYFEVTDEKRNGVSVRTRVLLNVVESEINTGWYVLKDIDGQTDFDYIGNDGKLHENVLLTGAFPRERIDGIAVKMIYQGTRYCHQMSIGDGRDTILTNRKALHILTDRDVRTYDANSIHLFKRYDEQFYTPPANHTPQSIYISRSDYGDVFLVNDGKLHAICGDIPGVGKYSAAKPGFYNAHKDMLCTIGGIAFFDTEERTFHYAESSGSAVHFVDDMFDYNAPLPYNMDYTLVNMFGSNTMSNLQQAGYAVMQGIHDGKYYLFGVDFDPFWIMGGGDFLTSCNEIPEGCKMPLAAVKAGSPSGSFIYFGDADKLCVYRNAPWLTEQEEVLVTFPAGETVGFILCSDLQVAVLTNSSAGWNLYCYELVGYGNPELNETPLFTQSGTGIGRYVMRRANY